MDDGSHGSFGGRGIPGDQKLVEALDVFEGGRQPPHVHFCSTFRAAVRAN